MTLAMSDLSVDCNLSRKTSATESLLRTPTLGQSVGVCSRPLIRTKRAAARAKDLAVLPVLEATLQMLHEKGGA